MLMQETATEQIQRQFFSAFPQIDANALNDIEIEAVNLAANLDGITENLGNLLHSVSFSKIYQHMNVTNFFQCDFLIDLFNHRR